MRKSVMVVDDSRVLEIQMKKLLEGSDFEIVAYFQDGESAIEQYSDVLPDVVTMDIIMPGMDGLQAARAIIGEHPDARIVMVSSLAYEDTINEANEIGAKAFIYKPFEREQLIEALEKATLE